MWLGSFDETVAHFVTRWEGRDIPFLRKLFSLLVLGRPVSPQDLSQLTGVDIASVEQKLVEGRADRDLRGNIVGLFGVTHEPTYNRIHVGETCLFSCCALVAHMIPLLLARAVIIESVNPVNHKLVKVHVSSKGVWLVEPKGAVGSLVITTKEHLLKDVTEAFCRHICHFPDSQTAEEFINSDARRYLVSVHELHGAARKLTDAIWS